MRNDNDVVARRSGSWGWAHLVLAAAIGASAVAGVLVLREPGEELEARIVALEQAAHGAHSVRGSNGGDSARMQELDRAIRAARAEAATSITELRKAIAADPAAQPPEPPPEPPGSEPVAESAPTEELVKIAPGTFTRGSDLGTSDVYPAHLVQVARPYLIGKREVTRRQWRAAMGTTPWPIDRCGIDCPVASVTWWDALMYCNARSAKEGLEPCYELSGCKVSPGMQSQCAAVRFRGLDCRGYRLPTEAEWEYAASAGSDGGSIELKSVAWFSDNSHEKPHPVGTKSANAWGLHDTLGNVSEWCWDAFDDYPKDATRDPMGPEKGEARIFRGGSWNDWDRIVTLGSRSADEPTAIHDDVGLRLARTAGPATPMPPLPHRVELPPVPRKELLKSAEEAMAAGRMEEAYERLTACVREFVAPPRCYELLATLLMSRSETCRAREAMKKFVRFSPGSAKAAPFGRVIEQFEAQCERR